MMASSEEVNRLSAVSYNEQNQKAKEKNIPVYGICGICTLTENQTIKLGLKKIIQLKTPEMEIDYAIENAKDLLIKNTIKLIKSL